MANLRNKDLHVVPMPDKRQEKKKEKELDLKDLKEKKSKEKEPQEKEPKSKEQVTKAASNRLVRQIMQEKEEEDAAEAELEEQIRAHRKKKKIQVIVTTSVIVIAAVAIFLAVYLPTYTSARVIDSFGDVGIQSNNYKEFADGIVKYSRDGVAYLNQRGEEQWNQSYQIKTPSIVTETERAVVYDKGGNDIIVFGKDGVKGEIHTTLPIEKADVSEQGIVSTILKDSTAPRVVCYDMAGNILVEHQTSLNGTGYPVKVSISPNGEVLQVVYIYAESGQIISKVAYYNFGKAGAEAAEHQVALKEYEGVALADGFFMDQNVSVVVGDSVLAIYKGESVPEQIQSIDIYKEIKSVFHTKKYVGLILRNEGKGGCELRLYDTTGKQILSKEFAGDYKHAKMCGNQVIMYDGKACNIILKNGLQRFEGEMDTNIMEIVPVMGVNKYIVINTNGMESVRLVK